MIFTCDISWHSNVTVVRTSLSITELVPAMRQALLLLKVTRMHTLFGMSTQEPINTLPWSYNYTGNTNNVNL